MSSSLNDSDIYDLLESETEPPDDTETPYDSGGGADLSIGIYEEAVGLTVPDQNDEVQCMNDVLFIVSNDASGFDVDAVSSYLIKNENDRTLPVIMDKEELGLVDNDIDTLSSYSVVIDNVERTGEMDNEELGLVDNNMETVSSFPVVVIENDARAGVMDNGELSLLDNNMETVSLLSLKPISIIENDARSVIIDNNNLVLDDIEIGTVGQIQGDVRPIVIDYNQLGVVDDVPVIDKVSSNSVETENDVRLVEISNEEIELDNNDINASQRSSEDQTLTGNDNLVENDIDALPKPNKVRKKSSNPHKWKVNVRKVKHNSGEEYLTQKGKLVLKKEVKTKKDCLNTCKFKCSTKITPDERQALFNGYYSLKDHDGKSLYLLNCTEKSIAARKQSKAENNIPSRREFSFRYFFNVNSRRIQVCKTFFLSTLDISQKPIYNVHKNKDPHTNLPKTDQRGKNASNRVPEYAKNDVRKHIQSFPVVESHYCRRDTSKQYLDNSLSISKMYTMFKEKYPLSDIKESKYRHIFVSEYNLDFHVPKSDRCDVCEEHKMSVKESLPIDLTKYETHIKDKYAMRRERNQDRESEDTAVLCFDLQNVITCPRAEISCFFYMRKLNVYNLTAHFKTKNVKKVYCAIWTELTGGRSGNDIASAVFKIVQRVLADFPDTEELVTWSDSCVPQNRNQMMTGAMMLVLQENPQLKSITMKYSTPGHGAVQEVDNIHSHIEKAFMTKEFYSPISLIRILININKKNPYTVIQMSEKDFLEFSSSSKELQFTLVPFTAVSTIILTQTFGEVKYCKGHGGVIKTLNLKPTMTTRKKVAKTPPLKENSLRSSKAKKRKQRSSSSVVDTFAVSAYKIPQKVSTRAHLQAEKKRDLQRMLKFMPLVDRDYYEAIFNA